MIQGKSWGLALVFGIAALSGLAFAQPGLVTSGGNAAAGDMKPRVRLIRDVMSAGFDSDRKEILTEQEASKLLGKEVLDRLKGQVDFNREKLLWVTWAGSSSSNLAFAVKEGNGKTTVTIDIQKSDPAFADFRPHGVLLVMPKEHRARGLAGPALRAEHFKRIEDRDAAMIHELCE